MHPDSDSPDEVKFTIGNPQSGGGGFVPVENPSMA